MTMETLVRSFLLLYCLYCLGTPVICTPKNVLLVVVDDLGARLGGAYDDGGVSVQTSNIDALASESLVLTKAYVQMALCAPSRTSFLTSRRPDTTRVYRKDDRLKVGKFKTIPEYFMDEGYAVAGGGKVFHSVVDNDDSYWTDPYYYAPNRDYWKLDRTVSYYEVSNTEESTTPLPDAQVTDWAVDKLDSLAPDAISGSTPFFMAVGYHKPHMPYACPDEYFDVYPSVSIANNPYPPQNMPPVAWYGNNELRQYDDIAALPYTGHWQDDILGEDMAINLRRGYYSCVSYLDVQIGVLLGRLSDLNLADDTIVALVSDHGFQLGESAEWGKFTNFERAVRVPMMIRIPGTTDAGVVSDELVELVDLFPTLVEATGHSSLDECPKAPRQSDDVALCTEGTSLMPLADQSYTEWKQYAFSQWMASESTMGYTIRSERYVCHGVYHPLREVC